MNSMATSVKVAWSATGQPYPPWDGYRLRGDQCPPESRNRPDERRVLRARAVRRLRLDAGPRTRVLRPGQRPVGGGQLCGGQTGLRRHRVVLERPGHPAEVRAAADDDRVRRARARAPA